MQSFRPATSLKSDSNTGVSCEYWEIFKSTYFKGWLLLELSNKASRAGENYILHTIYLKENTFVGVSLWSLHHRCFLLNFATFLSIPFSIEHLRWLLLSIKKKIIKKICKLHFPEIVCKAACRLQFIHTTKMLKQKRCKSKYNMTSLSGI